jgi:hypothetical protein
MISGAGATTTTTTASARRAVGLSALGVAIFQALVAVNLLGVQTAVFGSEVRSLDPRLVADHWVPALLTTIIQLCIGVALGALALALHRLLGAAAPERMRAATAAGFSAGVLFVAAGMAHAAAIQAARRMAAFDAAGRPEALAAADVAAGEVLATALRLAAVFALAVAILLWAPVAARERALPRAVCGVAVAAAVVSLLGFVQYEALYLVGVLTVVWAAWTAAACLSRRAPEGRPAA